MSMIFERLEPGRHFFVGNREHVKLPRIEVGPRMNGARVGFINALELENSQLSGFGPKVEVQPKKRCKEQ